MNPQVPHHRLYESLVQAVREYAIYMLDPSGIVLNWNEGAERAKGYAASEIVGRHFGIFYSENDRKSGLPQRNLEIAAREGHFGTEGFRYRKDGTSFWASVAIDPIYDGQRRLLGFAKVTKDLSDQREASRQLRHQATHDPLTGVLNRVGFFDELDSILPQIHYGSNIAVHLVDLDRFKPVNDSFGHETGDRILVEVASRLAQVAGASRVGRLGGDEFAVLQTGSLDEASATLFAERLIEAIEEPFLERRSEISIGASVGISLAPRDSAEAAELLRCADQAMYESKVAGRNRAMIFEPHMSERVLARSQMELMLRKATAEDGFHVVYQPIVDSSTLKVKGYEALLRWRTPSGRTIAPMEFIPLAEELGLMEEIGAKVLREVCRAALSWPEYLVASVNVSATQLRYSSFEQTVRETLEETGLPGHRLEIEITETAALVDMTKVRKTLANLRKLGVLIALDDFGTGFSSLSIIQHLPLTRIKIDKSFVDGIADTPESTAVIRSIITLCEGYGLATTAEGVETLHQSEYLRAIGCHELQGYYFGRPGNLSSEGSREEIGLASFSA